jgi:hypothetical protein
MAAEMKCRRDEARSGDEEDTSIPLELSLRITYSSCGNTPNITIPDESQYGAITPVVADCKALGKVENQVWPLKDNGNI